MSCCPWVQVPAHLCSLPAQHLAWLSLSSVGHLWGPPPSWSPSTLISGTEAGLVIPESLSLPKHLIIQSGPKRVRTHLFLAQEAEWKGWSMCLRSQGRCKGAWFVSLTFGSEVRYALPNWHYPTCQGNYKIIVNSLQGCMAHERDQRLGERKVSHSSSKRVKLGKILEQMHEYTVCLVKYTLVLLNCRPYKYSISLTFCREPLSILL